MFAKVVRTLVPVFAGVLAAAITTLVLFWAMGLPGMIYGF